MRTWIAVVGAAAIAACGEDQTPLSTPPATGPGPVQTETTAWGSGMGDGTWSYHPVEQASGPDYVLRFTLRIDQGTPIDYPVHQGGKFTQYNNNEDLGGYEAAAVLRRTAAGDMYRLMFSTRWQEVLLWSSRGGILAVRPFPLAAGKEYAVTATAAGQQISLQIDGQQALSYWDTTAPLVAGQAAIARKEGATTFSPASLQMVPAPAAAAPAHAANFAIRQWKGLRWGFDGDEPIFAVGLTPDMAAPFLPTRTECMGYEVKLVPGYAPQLYVPWYLQDWSGDTFNLGALHTFTAIDQGTKLVFSLACDNDGMRQDLHSLTTVTVSYDDKAAAYVYDQVDQFTVDQGATYTVSYPIDLIDPGLYNGVPSASPQGATWPEPHPWNVYQQLSGTLYKQPHNHEGWYPGFGSLAFYQQQLNYLKPDGGFWALVGDPVSNPVFQMQEPATRKEFTGLMCNWGYDLHLSWVPGGDTGATLQAGTYAMHWRLTSVPRQQGDTWLAQAGYATPTDPTSTWLLYTGGVGHVEAFDKAVSRFSPFGEYPWGPGELLDSKVGRTDRSSMRFDGPLLAGTAAGESQFMDGFAPATDYQVSVWVKTQGVQGEGPGILFSDKVYYPGVTGTADWQHIGFVTRPADPIYSVPFGLHHSGSGTVWFDDFEMRPVTADRPADPGMGTGPRPLTAVGQPRPDLSLLWTAKSDAADAGHTVLDLSGHGNHGSLLGASYLTQNDGHKVLSFAGDGGYVVSRGHPSVDFGATQSLSLWLRPDADQVAVVAAGGAEDHDNWRVTLFNGDVDVIVAGGRTTTTGAPVKAGAWTHLLVTYDGNQVGVYVNGHSLQSLAINGTWLGQADQGYFRLGTGRVGDGPDTPFSGRIAAAVVFPRALTAAEVATEYAGGPYAR